MTREREEAIKDFQELREHCIDSRLTESIDTAIAAMEQSEDMSVKEYREKMIAAFHETDHDELIALVPYPKEEDFDLLKNLLKQHPFVRPAEKTRKRERQIGSELVFYRCSGCGKLTLNKENFCANCGAKFEED